VRPAPAVRLLRALSLPAACSALAVACSEEPGGRWPERNYSGLYAASARAVADDCEMPVFAPADTLQLMLVHAPDNRARVRLSPVIGLAGAFQGDRLEAYAAVPVPVAPATPTAAPERSPRATRSGVPSPDSLRYRLRLDFAGRSFRGEYRVEQPPMLDRLRACSQRFELVGEELARPPGG
jgi:hypothetical protein